MFHNLNDGPFMTKALRKENMHRTKLRNKYNDDRSEENVKAFKKQIILQQPGKNIKQPIQCTIVFGLVSAFIFSKTNIFDRTSKTITQLGMIRKNDIRCIMDTSLIASEVSYENYFDETFYYKRCVCNYRLRGFVSAGLTSSNLFFITRILNLVLSA